MSTAPMPTDVMAEVLAEAWNIEHASGPKDATTSSDWESEAAQVVQGLTERGWRFTPPGDGSRRHREGCAISEVGACSCGADSGSQGANP